jgi:hypothetical protein
MKATAFLVVLTVALMPIAAWAEAPGLISYQGALTDEYDAALDTTVAMTFSIYDDSTGSGLIWTETQPSVAVSAGLFNVLLGRYVAIEDTVFDEPERWLGVQVGGDPELEPRERFASAAYALHAAGGGGGDDGDWTISGSDLYSSVSGNVGIGITNPGRKLHVVSGLSGDGIQAQSSSAPSIYLMNTGNAGAAQLWNMLIEDGTGKFILSNGGNQYAVVDTNGRVGIGTSNLYYQFQVKGAIPSTIDVLAHLISIDDGTDDMRTILSLRRNPLTGPISTGYGTALDVFLDNAISGSLWWQVSEGSDTDLKINQRYQDGMHTRMMIEAGGDVGVGTTYNLYKFTIKKSSDWEDGGLTFQGWDGNNFAALNLDGDENLKLWTYDISSGWYERALVDAVTGHIGVGAMDPTSRVDIEGDDGFAQLRLRASYTPTDTDDTNGEEGDIAWDDDYIYIKTSGGWKRAALSSW